MQTTLLTGQQTQTIVNLAPPQQNRENTSILHLRIATSEQSIVDRSVSPATLGTRILSHSWRTESQRARIQRIAQILQTTRIDREEGRESARRALSLFLIETEFIQKRIALNSNDDSDIGVTIRLAKKCLNDLLPSSDTQDTYLSNQNRAIRQYLSDKEKLQKTVDTSRADWEKCIQETLQARNEELLLLRQEVDTFSNVVCQRASQLQEEAEEMERKLDELGVKASGLAQNSDQQDERFSTLDEKARKIAESLRKTMEKIK